MGPNRSRTSTPPAPRMRSPSPHAPRPPAGRSTPPETVELPKVAVHPDGLTRRRIVPAERSEGPERSDRDIRRKRPQALSLLLRMTTLRRTGRAITLLALASPALPLPTFTALLLNR